MSECNIQTRISGPYKFSQRNQSVISFHLTRECHFFFEMVFAECSSGTGLIYNSLHLTISHASCISVPNSACATTLMTRHIWQDISIPLSVEVNRISIRGSFTCVTKHFTSTLQEKPFENEQSMRYWKRWSCKFYEPSIEHLPFVSILVRMVKLQFKTGFPLPTHKFGHKTMIVVLSDQCTDHNDLWRCPQ